MQHGGMGMSAMSSQGRMGMGTPGGMHHPSGMGATPGGMPHGYPGQLHNETRDDSHPVYYEIKGDGPERSNGLPKCHICMSRPLFM